MKLKYMMRGIGIGAVFMAALMYFFFGSNKQELSDEEIKSRAREFGMMTVGEFQDRELNSLKEKLQEKPELKSTDIADEKADKEAEVNTTKKNQPSNKTGVTTENKTGEDKIGEDKAGADKAGQTGENKTGAGTNTASEAGTAEKNKAGEDKTQAGAAGNGKAQAGNTQAGATGNSEAKALAQSSEPNKKIEEEKEDKTLKQATEVPKSEAENSKAMISITVAKGMSSESVAAALKAAGAIDDSGDFNSFLVKNGYASNIRVGSFVFEKGQSYSELAEKLTAR